MDRTDTTQMKKLNSREHCEAPRWTRETAYIETNDSSQSNKLIRSDHVQKFSAKDVFLSYSSKQNYLVRKLYRDLTNQGVSCFFHENRECFPVGEDPPPHIVEAIKTCKAAVLILSKDFLEAKWLMLQLSAFVEARDTIRTNPNLKILPFFFLISPDDLKNITAYNEKWKQLRICRKTRAKWQHSLNALWPNNGLKFSEGDDEVKFRDEIVKEIWHILSKCSPRCHIPCRQGQVRMCQVVADFFNTVQPNLLRDNPAQMTKLSSGECSQTPRSTEEATNLWSKDSWHLNKPICSDRGQKFLAKDVFLSHSSRQKNLVRQLYGDLTNQGVSCFFDEYNESFQVGEDFSPEAAKRYKAAILLLSKDFLQTKWAMQELSAFVEARDIIRTNPNLKILPLFFLISPDDLKNIRPYNKKWKQLGICKQTRIKWQHALNALRSNNGLKFAEGDDEVKFRDEIVKVISHILLNRSPRYRIPCMQGQIRICQEVADFFNTVQPELLSKSKKPSSGEYPQASRSKGKSKNLCRNDSSCSNKPIRSDRRQNFLAKDVFLSHSGKQKIFVRQLYKDLINQGVSCFFDEDRESLPVGEDFPSRIFEAAETCKAAILLLSNEFLETKWPMQELSAFVEARDIIRTNPNLKILPLFFLISPDVLKNITPDNEKWKQLGISGEKRAEWHHALNALRRNNGLKFSEGGDEVKFRDEIVREIWNLLPTHLPRYHVPCMQGEERMCQEVADFINTVRPNEKGIRIAGLYGIAGHGKTTLCKAFCNFKLGDFEGKVCYLEFSRGDAFERMKVALQSLTHCPPSHLQTMTSQDQAQAELYKRGKSQRVLLVLDNISAESIDEASHYVEAGFRKDSCILLSARSVDVLIKHFKVESESCCMRVPSLEEDEAIRILLERTSIQESTLGATDRALASKCAKRCSFKEVGWRGRTFHPLALKAFGGHLYSKYGSQLSKWVGLVDRSGYGLDDLLAVLGKSFDDLCPQYRTIFLLLTVYMPPNMSRNKATQWLAINCNKEMSFVQKAVEDLCKMSFIEEFGPEIQVHDLYIEFAESKANEMGRWLWWKGDPSSTRGLISSEGTGFELAKLEKCMHRRPSQIDPRDLQNLLLLQLLDVKNMSKLDLSRMGRLRNITLHKCTDLATIEGMENLQHLAWLQISKVNPMFKLPELGSLESLQHLEIDIGISRVLSQLGDLTGCISLREIKVCCPSLLEFPRLKGLPHLENVEFRGCDKVKGPLDCRGCVELQSVVLHSCCQMDSSPLIVGCKKLSKIVLWGCDVTACPEINVPKALKTMKLLVSSEAVSAPKGLESCYGLKNLRLWNMEILKELPSFRLLSDLTVLELCNCGLRETPDLRSCGSLKDVSFLKLIYLERFPSFSGLTKLKNLQLRDCWSVQDPPDISGCHQLQVLHLVFNDNMKGLPNMGEFPKLEEIKLSWHSKYEVTYHRKYSHPYEDPESCLESFKDESFQNSSDADMSLQRLEFNVEIVPQSLEGETVPYGLEFDGDLQSFAEMVSQRERFPLSLEFNNDLQFVWSTIEKKPFCEDGSTNS